MKRIFKHTNLFFKTIKDVLISPTFLTLSLVGNLIVLIFSIMIYYAEKGINSTITSFPDAVWFCFSTASTVGYGDITPKSLFGRILGIILMLIGVAIFGIYTALFAQAIIDKRK